MKVMSPEQFRKEFEEFVQSRNKKHRLPRKLKKKIKKQIGFKSGTNEMYYNQVVEYN